MNSARLFAEGGNPCQQQQIRKRASWQREEHRASTHKSPIGVSLILKTCIVLTDTDKFKSQINSSHEIRLCYQQLAVVIDGKDV